MVRRTAITASAGSSRANDWDPSTPDQLARYSRHPAGVDGSWRPCVVQV